MFRQIILIILCLVFLGGAALFNPIVGYQRAMLASTSITGLPGETRPEIVLLTHVLGGFRGILVDAVWLRAAKLQQAQKYWELYQLYDWMGKLEPRLEDVWDFNAWNMSYNLVAELSDSEARWQWIARAIELARDQGLNYNPRSGKIMERIAWTFFHKIGRELDLHNYYYKHRWALIMNSVLLDRDDQNVEKMAEAPHDLAVLLQDPDVVKLLSAAGLDPAGEDVQKLSKISSLNELPPSIMNALEAGDQAGRDKIRWYLGSRILREVYKMDIGIMVDMERQFGKFDWRLPDPHAIYWSEAANRIEPTLKRQMNYDRILLFSLQETMRRGIIAYASPNPNDPLVMTSDLSKIQPIDQFYYILMAKHSIEREDWGASSLRDGHVTFLEEAAFDLYFAGYEQEALKYYTDLNRLYNKPSPPPAPPLKDYMISRVKELVDVRGTPQQVRAFIDSLVFRACIFLCLNKPAEARTYENLARRSWDAYLEYRTAVTEDQRVALGLPSYEEIVENDVRNILAGRTSFPPQFIPTLRAIVGVKEGEEVVKLQLKDTIVPPIPPSSPVPK